jgi:glycosyltransferase involved in cell wall biosynthesis
MIHEVVGNNNAIGKVALSDVRIALSAGYDVTVISKIIDESLKPRVTWAPMYVPRRLFYVQWTTARFFITRALGGALSARRRAGLPPFDIIHAHQPQVAHLADVFQCHFLTRVAWERNCLETRTDWRSRFVRLQQEGVLHAEDRCYRRWNPHTYMLYDSALTREEFHRLYGACPLEDVLVYDFPPLNIASPAERTAAREKFLGPHRDHAGPVVGYLGGLQERKGYKRLVDALKGTPDLLLLMGGPYCDNYHPPELAGRIQPIGLTGDTAGFYAACDVLIVPSLFEPLGLVAFEAAARGTPVIATPEVGALPHLLEFQAGERWSPGEPLGPLIRHMAEHKADYLPGITRMAETLSARNYGIRLLRVYDRVRERRPARERSIASPAPEPNGPARAGSA